MKKHALALLLLGSILFILSCATTIQKNTPAHGTTPTPETIAGSERKLEREIEQGEKLWQEHNISSYRIQVETASIWHLQLHDITVQDGQVVTATASCQPAPTEMGKCHVEDFDPEDFTVSGLFVRAHHLAEVDRDIETRLEFDPTYGFPSLLSFNDPDLIDEEWIWRVKEFVATK